MQTLIHFRLCPKAMYMSSLYFSVLKMHYKGLQMLCEQIICVLPCIFLCIITLFKEVEWPFKLSDDLEEA